jgi:outer membrane protein OmpU
MKKVLLASTVLAMTATVAAAEVTLSGDARMGIFNDFVAPGETDGTGFTSRARVTFTMAGETDGGLAFGASFRADNAGGAAAGTAGSVFISGAFGKLSMGDVDGAAAAAVGHVDGVGLTGLGDFNENIFIANGGFDNEDIFDTDEALTGDPSALYEYTAGSLTLTASVTQPTFTFDAFGDTYSGDAYALGAAYTVGDYKVSIGYEKLDVQSVTVPADNVKADHWIIGADATFGQITVKARYGSADLDENGAAFADLKQTALSATYAMDALSVTVYGSQKDVDNGVGANLLEVDAYGIGASYDLGGGASVRGGVAKVKTKLGAADSVSDTAFDLGVAFSF